MDFYQSKNIEFYNFLNETFNLRKSKNWDDIARNITKAKISATYKFFSKLYPRNIDYSSKFNSDSKTFKSLHYNTLDANRIINEVVRFSLYSDEIIVFHPLQNPSITNQQLDPIKAPKVWLQNFLDSLYFYVVLQKWVRAGIVKLIINPYDYDFALRDQLDKKAVERVNSFMSDPEYNEKLMLEASNSTIEMLAPSFSGKSTSQIKHALLGMKSPIFKEEEAELYAQKIFDKQHLNNPLYKKLNVPFSRNAIMSTRGGGNIESVSYVAKLINGNIYTTNEINWLQMKRIGDVGKWTKIAHLYSKIELPFLNNVDTSFALNIREDDRLGGVRTGLRNIYSSVSSMTEDDLDENLLQELNEGFIEELKKADAEWSFIKKKAKNQRAYWGACSTIGIPIIHNEFSLIPLLLSSAFWLGNNIRNEKLNLNKFKTINPLSVYVDLKHQEPSFFSELKNCIY